jgi:hypothetical protein
MARKRAIIGAGQCGMKLANEFIRTYKSNDEIYNLSTSVEDSVGIPSKRLIQVSTGGSGKKFSNGSKIWEESIPSLKKQLNNIFDKDVIYFTSAGGGSGSSSIRYITDILLENNNRIFLVLILPFGYEALPFKPNTLQTLSRLQDDKLLNKISVMLFDNDKLSKKFSDVEVYDDKEVLIPNLEKINNYILKSTSITLDLVNLYHVDGNYSPFTIDALEHDSVIFSKGFIGIDFASYKKGAISPKFDYGKISDCKNVILAKAIRLKESDYIIDQQSGEFMDAVKKLSRKAKNARVMYGIMRTNDIDHGTFIIIGNNLDITKYITKIKNKVGVTIENYRREDEREKVLQDDEVENYDI